MVVKEKKTTTPVKATASKAAPIVVPDKKVITSRKKSEDTKEQITKKSVSIPLKKTREPKNGFVVITNNIQKKTGVKKVETQVVSTSVLPKPAIRSPFRFPLPLQYTMSNVARVVGIAFVTIGALLSFINLPIGDTLHEAIRGHMYTASTGDTLTSTTTDTTSSGTGSFDTTSDPNISVQGTVLSGNVPVYITVPLATEVKVIALQKSTNQLITLGNAVRADNTTWTYQWNTMGVTNAEYRIKLLITNQYTAYDYTDSVTYEVRNTDTSSTTVPSNTTSTTTASGTSTTTTNTTNVTFTTESTGTSGSERTFSITAPSASRVTVQARNTVSNTLYFVGQASPSDGGGWYLVWNSKNIPDGTYYFFASAVINEETFKSANKKITVANSSTATTPGATTSAQTIDPTTTTVTPVNIDTESLKPSIALSFKSESPLAGPVGVSITTSPVLWVELYAIPKNSLTVQFLGLASKISDTSWTYNWNTTQAPNGEYRVYARVKSVYGFTEGERTEVRVFNQIVDAYTEEQENQISTLQSVGSDLAVTTSGASDDVAQGNPDVYIEPVDSFVQNLNVESTTSEDVSTLLVAFRKDLDALLSEYARATRAGDTEALRTIENKFESLKNDLIKRLPDTIDKKERIDQISTYLSEVTYKLRELTLRNETVLRERVGDAITKDTDKDGISDYDEVHLYKTNPFSADTDGDGHIDSSEITLGFNPHDSSEEALVTYQSPLDSGIVRDDILTVDEMVTLTPDSEGDAPKVALSGKGLPNSFVTLYIFSTPIVITVKTDADGNWSYIFDKELENGNHEMYVGIIDNTGEVVAKSNAFGFVKTAEAFTKIDSRTAVIEAESLKPSLLSGNVLLVIGSMVVVSLGLVLLLIGVYAKRSVRVEEVTPATP